MSDVIVPKNSTPVVPDRSSYVDWGAILGGAFVAAALSTVMTSFGAAIGLSLTSPLPGKGVSLSVMAITTGLWVLWIGVSSFSAGGYIAGRLRRRAHDANEHESNVRDGAHGAIVWALGTVMLAIIATSTIGSVTGTAATAVGSAAGGIVAPIAQKAVDPLQMAADRLLRADNPAASPAAAPGTQMPDNRDEVVHVLSATVSSGELSAPDKAWLAGQIAARTGLSQAEAEKRIDDTVAQAKKAVDEARQAADTARKYGILVAFLAAASLLISGAAAWGAATIGGNHRDENSEFAFFTRW